MILAKVAKDDNASSQINKLTTAYSVTVLEEKKQYYLLESCSDHSQEDAILNELAGLKVLELVRTGKIAISK